VTPSQFRLHYTLTLSLARHFRGDCPTSEQNSPRTADSSPAFWRVGICTTISLTSLPYLRDNQYIAQAQCSDLPITPLFQNEADSEWQSERERIRNGKSMKQIPHRWSGFGMTNRWSRFLTAKADSEWQSGGAFILASYQYRILRCQHISE